jgi:iron(III) transport system permease protein
MNKMNWFRGVDTLLQLLLLALVTIVVIIPLAFTIDASFYTETRVGLSAVRSLKAVADVYASGEYLNPLWNALVLSVEVTALSLVLGLTLAMLIGRTDIPGRRWLDLLILLPLFLSPFTGLIAWIALGSEKTGFVNAMLGPVLAAVGFTNTTPFNIWSFAGVIWVMVLFFAPLAYTFTLGALRGVDSSLEEAARTTGASPLVTMFKVTLPLTLPATFAAGLLIFILAAEIYTIPGIISANAGFTTLPWRIFEDATIFPVHRAHAAAGGTILLWVALIGLWLQRKLTRASEKFVTVSGKGFRGRPIKLGAMKYPVIAAVWIYICIADALPLIALCMSSLMKYSAPRLNSETFTLKHYAEFVTIPSMGGALLNTFVLAILSAAICVLIGFAVSYMEVRVNRPLARIIAFVSVLPIAVPGLVYGLGLMWAFLRSPIYGTIWILLLAYVAKCLPYSVLVSRAGILQLHPELEQSARVAGATRLQSVRLVNFPLMKGTLVTILFFVMLMSIKELSASALLYSTSSQVLSVLTWQYMDSGEYQFAAMVGVIQTLAMLALVMFVRWVFCVRLEENFGARA